MCWRKAQIAQKPTTLPEIKFNFHFHKSISWYYLFKKKIQDKFIYIYIIFLTRRIMSWITKTKKQLHSVCKTLKYSTHKTRVSQIRNSSSLQNQSHKEWEYCTSSCMLREIEIITWNSNNNKNNDDNVPLISMKVT